MISVCFENLTKPPFIFGNENYTSEAAIGLLFGLSCAILVGLVTNTLRKIGKNVHFTINSLYYSITGMVVLGCTIMLTTGFSMPCQVSATNFMGRMMSLKMIIYPCSRFEYKPYLFLGRSLDVILHRTKWHIGAELYGTGMSERKGRQSRIGKKFANNIFLYYASTVHWRKLELPFSRRSRPCPHFSSADGYP